jgi:hypothetical protein
VYEQHETCAQLCAPTKTQQGCAQFFRAACERQIQSTMRVGWMVVLTCGAWALFAPALLAAKPESVASSSRTTRDEAVRAIPKDKLTPSGQQKVASVLKQVSIFRRLPTQVIECDPNLYLFLVEHPEMVVNMWEVMDVSDMKLEKTGQDQYKMNDGAGTIGKVEMLWRSHDLHIMFAEGAYSGPMFASPVKGKCLLVLKTGYVRETNGKYYVTCRLDTFIQLENVGIEFVARTFQPMIGKTADHNFRETAAFLGMISRSAEVQHPSLKQLTGKLTATTDEDRAQFVAITDRIGHTAQQLELEQGEEIDSDPAAATAAKPAASKPLAMAPARPTARVAKTPPPASGAPTGSTSWPKAPIPSGTRKTVMKPSTAR